MISKNLIEIIRDRVALDMEDRKELFSVEIAKIREELNAKNVLYSSAAIKVLTDAVATEIRRRCLMIWQIIERGMNAKGAKLGDNDSHGIEVWLNKLIDEFSTDIELEHEKTKKLGEGYPIIVETVENIKKAAKARIKSEIEFVVLAESNKKSESSENITIQNVGILQTGTGARACIALTLGEGERRKIDNALSSTENIIKSSSTINSEQRDAILELLTDIRDELKRGKPNTYRIRGIIQALASVVQTMAAAPGAYKLIKGIAPFFGLQLP